MTEADAEKRAAELLPCGTFRYCVPPANYHDNRCKASKRKAVATALLELAQGEYNRYQSLLTLAVHIIEDLAEQQAMPDNSYLADLELIQAALIPAVSVEHICPPDLTAAITELHHYCAQRGIENEKRAITAYGAEASWHSAKAETYRRIEARLDEMLDGEVERSPWKDVRVTLPPLFIYSLGSSRVKPYVLAVDTKGRMSVGFAYRVSTGEINWTFAKPIGQPTHWMPLPIAPPIAGDETKEE